MVNKSFNFYSIFPIFTKFRPKYLRNEHGDPPIFLAFSVPIIIRALNVEYEKILDSTKKLDRLPRETLKVLLFELGSGYCKALVSYVIIPDLKILLNNLEFY